MQEVKIINKSQNPLPVYMSPGSAGADVYSANEQDITILPGKIALIPTGLFMMLPEGYEAQIRTRSGLCLKHGIVVANGVGTIDSDYRGEIGILLLNVSDAPYTVKKGERIAQMVIARYEQAVFVPVQSIAESERNDGGFGHSGV